MRGRVKDTEVALLRGDEAPKWCLGSGDGNKKAGIKDTVEIELRDFILGCRGEKTGEGEAMLASIEVSSLFY